MTQEATPVLTFGNYKKGLPIQVDIHDPTVRGLIKAGYLKIRWKEPHGADPLDPAGPDSVPAGSVDPDDPRGAEAAQVDDQSEHRSAAEGADSGEFGA